MNAPAGTYQLDSPTSIDKSGPMHQQPPLLGGERVKPQNITQSQFNQTGAWTQQQHQQQSFHPGPHAYQEPAIPRELHPSNNFYRTEMMSDQQIIEQAYKEKAKSREMKTLENLSKDESVKLMKELLKEVGVVSTWKWDDAHRNIKSDEKYRFIKLSMQEKKSTFSDYLQETRQQERRHQMLIKEKQRELFLDMLEENRHYLGLNSSSKYYQISKRLAKRDYKKFMAVDERDREDIFQDYIDILYKQERDVQVELSQKQITNIKTLLEENFDLNSENKEKITIFTKFDEANSFFENNEIWQKTPDLERIIGFEDFIKNAVKQDFQSKKRER